MTSDPTTEYAERVRDGDIVAGPHVRIACERHLADLERIDLVFDTDKAGRIMSFFHDALHLSGGQFEGKRFELMPWQQFIIGSLYGWTGLTGNRRFRRAYVEVAKGSGKSPFAAGVAIYAITSDDEPRSEAYLIARTMEQALVTFRSAVAFVQQSAFLRDRLKVIGGQNPYNISHHDSMSFFRRMSSDQHGKGKSGPLPHLLLCDEYHEQDTTSMLDFFDEGKKSRRRPITLITTNAGSGTASPCGQEHDYAVRVANGSVIDDRYFAYVAALDDGDKPMEDESCWIKTNPGLPTIPTYDYIREQVKNSQGMPSKRALVERLNFCIWTDAESPWILREKWLEVEVDKLPDEIEKAPCYIGLDLSLKADLTAGALVWDLSEGDTKRYAGKVAVWTPKDTMEERGSQDNVPYRAWADDGYIIAVPGSVIQYQAVAKWISEISSRYNLVGVAYDPWKIDLLQDALDSEGVQVTRSLNSGGVFLAPHPQGYVAGARSDNGRDSTMKKDRDRVQLWMPRSIDALESAILENTIQVESNPVLRWAALGSVVITDASDNRRLTKSKSTTRIDAMVALTMAMGFADANIKSGGSSLVQHYSGASPMTAWSV